MDEELLRRFRDGDPTAATAVRNHLRAVAARVLAAPQWSFIPADQRQPLEQGAAAEAMIERQRDSVGMAAEAMAAASRAGLERLRRHEAVAEAEHPTTAALVAVGLETASAAQAAQLRPHLEGCTTCKRHVELVGAAARAAATASVAVNDTPAVAAAPPVTRKAPDTHGRPHKLLRDPNDPISQVIEQPAPRTGTRAGLVPIALILLAMAVFAYAKAQLSPEETRWAIAAMLPPELPPTGRAELYDGDAREALLHMRDGDCPRAAAMLRTVRGSAPDDPWLQWYEGLAYVCTRDGADAVPLLQELADGGFEPFGLDWWLGQALLLAGRHDEGLRHLDQLARTDHPRARQAEKLAAKVRKLL
ncbi:MAG: hypothetical protein H6739_02965 [Alphaproteobacteria bacterium]|nr:hypothetical protein [Alphaproteobacteria bacterium]